MTLPEIFDSFNRLNVLILGDIMLDAYVWGKVERISPEAPVPVVVAQRREFRLGGAGNVVLNVAWPIPKPNCSTCWKASTTGVCRKSCPVVDAFQHVEQFGLGIGQGHEQVVPALDG